MDLEYLQSSGINLEHDAVEIERALGIRFSKFTPEQREIWRLQTLCLKQYALTPNYERAAQRASVTVNTIEEWERDNVLGFVKRKEVAELEFSDAVQEILLDLTLKPDSPPTLLLALLRKQVPEKFGPVRRRQIAGPTKSKVLRQVVEEYRRVVQERERLLDEEQRLLKSQADDSTATEDALPAGDGDDRRAPEDKQFQPVWNWSLDGSVRTKNN